jgi:hypothetical protein
MDRKLWQFFTAAKALPIALAGWAAYLNSCRRLEHDRHAASTDLESTLFCALTGILFGAADMSVLAGTLVLVGLESSGGYASRLPVCMVVAFSWVKDGATPARGAFAVTACLADRNQFPRRCYCAIRVSCAEWSDQIRPA